MSNAGIWIPISILTVILLSLVIIVLISILGDKNIKLLWKATKIEFVIIILINTAIWWIMSTKVGTWENICLAILIFLIILFIFVGLFWRSYYRNTFLVQEKIRYVTFSDGFGPRGPGGPRSGVIDLCSLYIVGSIVLTIINIFCYFQK